MRQSDTLTLTPELAQRLTPLADRLGLSVHDLAVRILEQQADSQDRLLAEYAEDNARWQRYLSTGHAIDGSKMREHLASLARTTTVGEPR